MVNKKIITLKTSRDSKNVTNYKKNMIDLKINPLDYVLENNLINDGLWLEFGVFNGRTINKISKYNRQQS